MNILLGIFIPFIGTTLGAAMVFFMKKNLSARLEKILLGFASGVMVAASVWSLLIPSIENTHNFSKFLVWIPSVIGFLLGIIILQFIDKYSDKIILKSKDYNDILVMMIAIVIHNIPEGMAVGVILAGSMNGSISITQAILVSIGVAIQNFPEGSIVSMPLRNKGMKKSKAFIYGVLSGAVEPIAAFLTLILTSISVPILPYFLSFAAGAMIFVVVSELIPQINKEKNIIGTLFFSLGFVLMMILDVTFG